MTFQRTFGLALPGGWPGAFAVAPTMPYPVVRLPPGGRVQAVLARWGLVPILHRGLLRQFKASTFNARAEDAPHRPTFALAYREARRCLVLVSGFYEWTEQKGSRVPHRVIRADGRPLVLGGLWETWTGEFGPLETFTLLTCAANPTVSALHDRMPVVLDREHWRAWLDPRTSERDVRALTRPCPDGVLAWSTVSDALTRPRHKTREDAPALVMTGAERATTPTPHRRLLGHDHAALL